MYFVEVNTDKYTVAAYDHDATLDEVKSKAKELFSLMVQDLPDALGEIDDEYWCVDEFEMRNYPVWQVVIYEYDGNAYSELVEVAKL